LTVLLDAAKRSKKKGGKKSYNSESNLKGEKNLGENGGGNQGLALEHLVI